MKKIIGIGLLGFSALAFADVVIDGTVTDKNGQPVKKCEVYFNKEMWVSDDSVQAKCDQNGRYSATIDAGAYNSMYICDGDKYGKTALEFWGWNVDLTASQTIDAAFDTIEVFSLSAWSSNGGSNSLFAAFRPMSLVTPQYRTEELNGLPISVIDITPAISAESIAGFIDGKEIELMSFSWAYERLNSCRDFSEKLPRQNGCYMPMIIAQFKKPRLDEGEHKLKVRLTDLDSKNIGEGITSFVSNKSGFGF